MDSAGKRERIVDCVWFLTFALASSAWCIGAAQQLGATFDEPVYLIRGLEHWRTGSAQGLIRMGTMPLPADVNTLPLYLWERWTGNPIDPERDWERVVSYARAGTLLFWWLLLFYAGRTGRLLAGKWGGRLAVALIACEPSFLAHASLATTDIAVTACLLALVYYFRTGRDGSWWRRIALPAFWFGTATLAKASGMVYGGICLLVMEIERLAQQGAFNKEAGTGWRAHLTMIWQRAKPARRDLARIAGCGLLWTFLYCGCDWQPEPSFVAWSHGLPDGAHKQMAVWLAEHVRVFSNAGEGIIRQVKHNMHGHGTYILGRTDARSLWYYFPLTLSIKLTAPLLLAPIVLLLLMPRSLTNWACLTAAVLVLFSLTWHVQIGIRLVLPLAALGAVGVAAAIANGWRHSAPLWKRRLLAGGAAAGIVWSAAAAVLIWPEGLCYVNELWGGARQGYRRVSEANYDWGQGLPELVRWEKQHGVPSLDVWYFGSDPTLARLPLHTLPLHTLPIHAPKDVWPYVQGRLLAVSTTLRYGPPGLSDAHIQTCAFLAAHRPVARTTTFLIYDFTGTQ